MLAKSPVVGVPGLQRVQLGDRRRGIGGPSVCAAARIRGRPGTGLASGGRLVGVAASGALAAGAAGPGDRLVLESAETGWRYALALPTGQVAAVFMTDADAVHRRSTSLDAMWRREFVRTGLVSAVLAALVGPPSVVVRPADTSILEPMHGPGWVAVGEAGAAYDPLSGQGVVEALDSGLAAAAAIDRALDGDRGALDEFALERTERFHHYLIRRRETYRQERHWPASPFWARRE